MSSDFEDRLRRSLESRADDVTPDPRMYARVQSRIRRGRNFRLAFAVAASTLVVGGVALAAPGILNNRIEFEPGPVATQPGGASETVSETPEPAATAPTTTPPTVFTDGESVFTMYGDRGVTTAQARLGGDARLSCGDQPCEVPETISFVRSASPPGDLLEVAMTTAEECPHLYYAVLYTHDGAQPVDDPIPDDRAAQVDAAGCATSPTFSPDGESLVWAAATADGWVIEAADWTDQGVADDITSFGLPWSSDEHVDIQDWVWQEQTATTAKGFLVLRTQQDGAWILQRMPIERQADGELAVTSDFRPLSATFPKLTPVAFASGGGDYAREEDYAYDMELDMAPEGIDGGRIVLHVGAEGGGSINLPPELFSNTNPPFDVSQLWMAAAGDTLLYGNSATAQAWVVDWSTGTPQRTNLVLEESYDRFRSADLLDPAASRPGDAPGETASKTEVDVYFGMTGADACVADDVVARQVDGPGVARAALTELLEGPTSTESNEGVVSPFNATTADALNDIVIVDGQAQVDFRDFSEDVDNDSCTKSAIVDSLNKTLFQFETIKSTLYSFDGDTEAWNTWLGLHSEGPPAAVVQTQKAIYDAALARDWDALRALQRETSCTLSDQKEPCVPYWREQTRAGEDPMGTLVDVLNQGAARSPDFPMWIYPAEAAEGGYSGPRVGIDEDGVWRYYVQSGG